MRFIENNKLVDRVTDNINRTYRKDCRACNSLNKILGTDFKAVYREERNYNRGQWSYPSISMDYETVYIIRQDNKVVSFNVSEWFSIDIEE